MKLTSNVKIVIENMSGQGNLIGSKLQDLRDVIDLVEDKSRIGVCIDTCHTFASGYDISTKEKLEAFLKEFDEVVGFEYLTSIHLNDSKSTLNSNRDLHENLGEGFLGLECFRCIANNKVFENIPIVLETPNEKRFERWGEEVKLLEWMIGRDGDDEEFKVKAQELHKQGEVERKKFIEKHEKARARKKPASTTLDSLVSKKQKK